MVLGTQCKSLRSNGGREGDNATNPPGLAGGDPAGSHAELELAHTHGVTRRLGEKVGKLIHPSNGASHILKK